MATENTEQLALSASLFTSSIDAWIPSKFGPKTSDLDRKIDFDRRLKEAALQGENERLGAGHPDVGRYKPKGPSLSSFEKKLGKVDRGQNSAEVVQTTEADSESDGESRVKSVSKRKSNPVNDLLGGKKKSKSKVDPVVEHPLLRLGSASASASSPAGPFASLSGGSDNRANGQINGVRPEIPTVTRLQQSSPPSDTDSLSPGAGNFSFAGPVALSSPGAIRDESSGSIRQKRPREPSETPYSTPIKQSRLVDAGLNLTRGRDQRGSVPQNGEDDAEKMDVKPSKTQRRRDARKRAKLTRQT